MEKRKKNRLEEKKHWGNTFLFFGLDVVGETTTEQQQ